MSRPSATRPGGTAKSRCRCSNALANLGHGGDLRGRVPGPFRPQLGPDVDAVRARRARRREPRRSARPGPRRSRRAPAASSRSMRRLQRGERHEPIEGAAVEVVPAELLRQHPADRPLARAARAVDRDDGSGRRAHAPSPPGRYLQTRRRVATSRKFGKDVATSAVLRISIGALAQQARDRERHRDAVIAAAVDRAAAQTAARRCAHRRAAPRPRCPTASSPCAMTAIRSVSFLRSSSAPLTIVVARRSRGGDEQDRELVDRERHELRRHVDPAELALRDQEIGDRLGADAALGCAARSSAPISRRIVSRPVRVGLMPTFSISSPSRAPRQPATMKNAAEREVAGHPHLDAAQRGRAVERHRVPCAVGRQPEPHAHALQHALGVVAARARRADRRRAARHRAPRAAAPTSPARSPSAARSRCR